MSGVLSSDRNALKQAKLYEFTQGIAQDQRLFRQEIKVQIAWAKGLMDLGILTQEEFNRVSSRLAEASRLIEVGHFDWRTQDEDIHMNLERYVTEHEGVLGKKMHLGRSRNDLIATTLRLFVADELQALGKLVDPLIEALKTKGLGVIDVIVPGCTHLQNGQPIRYSQILASYAQMLRRDQKSLEFQRSCALSSMPLGSAALAGTPIAIDEKKIANLLGFLGPSSNSYDSVGDRDFMLGALDAISQMAVHLSRIAEDFVIYSSTAIGLLDLPKDWSTGSSIMPNKRNPDVAELARSKAAHCIGAAFEAKTLVKGLPTSYQSDLHELKQVFLRSLDEVSLILGALTPFVDGLGVKAHVAKSLLNRGHILATEIADELVSQGMAFRDAYKQVAALVETADQSGKQVHEVLSNVQGLSPQFVKSLDFEWAVERRKGPGGTSKASVLAQLASL